MASAKLAEEESSRNLACGVAGGWLARFAHAPKIDPVFYGVISKFFQSSFQTVSIRRRRP